jgi:hypothetical protein
LASYNYIYDMGETRVLQTNKESRSVKREESKEKSREEKRVVTTLWFKEEPENKLILGVIIYWQGFHYNLINEVDE